MRTEFFLRGLPKQYMRIVLEKLHKTEIICTAKARRNLCGSTINIFGKVLHVPVSIKKEEEFIVFSGSEENHRAIKRWFFPFPVTLYQAEDILCQTKWKGQPYKFFFKDVVLQSKVKKEKFSPKK